MKYLQRMYKLVSIINFKTITYCSLVFAFTLLYSCTPSEVDSSEETHINAANSFNYESLAQQVIIRRTDYGVPHIFADNIEAAGFAMGYVQMEDYGNRILEGLLRARGEWAKYNELERNTLKHAIDSDAANRQSYARAVETWHLLETDTRDIMKGFAKGVNHYIQLNPDKLEDWAQPFFTGYDVHARGITGPSSASIKKFMDAFEQKKLDSSVSLHNNSSQRPEYGTMAISSEETSPEGMNMLPNLENAKTVWARLAARAEEEHTDVGSNVWALAPSRTKSGNAILVRNPHLSWDAGYYEAHIVVPGKLNFYGDYRLGGSLGIIGGFNERLGWATTNNNPKQHEIYALKADPNHPDNYLLDGASLSLEKETVKVEYKKGKRLARETREFLSTPFGPVIHQEDGIIYVIKSSRDGVFQMEEQFFRMMKAQNLEEWKNAMNMRARTSSNLTYADADGNIFYVWNGSVPNLPHQSGGDTLAIHVSSANQIWNRLVDWEDLPQLENPEGGYVRNENDPFHFTNLNEILDANDFPDYFPDPQLRLRSQYSLELIDNEKKFSLEDIVELKHSMGMILADRVKSDLIVAVRSTNPTGEIADAIQLMEEWDNTAARKSRGGVLYKTWWERYVEQSDPDNKYESSPESVGFSAKAEDLFTEPWSPQRPTETPNGLANPELAVEAFKWAVTEAKDRYGAWDIEWGEVHRARIGDKDFAVGGCTGLLGCFRVLWYNKDPEDEQKLVVQGGDGWVLAIEFGDIPRAYSVLAYGQSDNEESPHFNDQLELFTNNEMKRVVYTQEDIMKQIIREYRPGQEN